MYNVHIHQVPTLVYDLTCFGVPCKLLTSSVYANAGATAPTWRPWPPNTYSRTKTTVGSDFFIVFCFFDVNCLSFLVFCLLFTPILSPFLVCSLICTLGLLLSRTLNVYFFLLCLLLLGIFLSLGYCCLLCYSSYI